MPNKRVVSLHHARQLVIASFEKTRMECVLTTNALHRILAEDIRANRAMPSLSIASRDGYALISSDVLLACHETPIRLGILRDIASNPNVSLLSGTAIYVQCGDILPQGADAVISHKHTYREPDSPSVQILDSIERGNGVLEAGTTASAGDMLIRRGVRIAPQQMGILGLWGIDSINVACKPCVKVVLSTAAKNNSLVNSLGLWLKSMLEIRGGSLTDIQAISPGRLPAIELLSQDESEADITIIVMDDGQASDPIINALRYKSELLFERIQISPSGTTAFGKRAGCNVLLCSLSNLDVILESILYPCLREMTGCKGSEHKLIIAKSAIALRTSPGNASVLRATAEFIDSTVWVRPTNGNNPWVSSAEQADGYILVPEESEQIRRGDFVDFMLFTR